MMIGQEELFDLFTDADEKTQSEIVRILEENMRPVEKKNYEELEKEIEELKKQVEFWKGLYSSATRMHINTHDYYQRVIKDQQRIVDRLRKKRRA